MNTTEKREHTVIALGFFDGVHRGHQAVIGQAVELAARRSLLPCAFTFDTAHSAPSSKGELHALTTVEQRERELTRLGIAQVFCPAFESFRDLSGEAFVREMLYQRFGARALCCGRDFRFGRYAGCGVDDLERLCSDLGIELCITPEVMDGGEPVSSTRIRAALAQGKMDTVNRLLGRRYGFELEVVHGRRLGRQMQYPTINQLLPEGCALPRFGVYAAFAEVDGRAYPAVTNVGVKPTVKSDNRPVAETHIPGLTADLYGRVVPVTLVRFLRPEVRFSSIEELRENIRRDTEHALEACKLYALQ